MKSIESEVVGFFFLVRWQKKKKGKKEDENTRNPMVTKLPVRTVSSMAN